MTLVICCVSFLPAGWAESTAQAADDFVVHNGDRERKRIAITMDDCYRISNVKRTLMICQEYQVPVTFFIVGSSVKEADRSVWYEALSLGCEIGNHTYGHVSLAKASPDLIRSQINDTQDALDRVLGFHYPMRYFRPPYGKIKRPTGETILPLLQEAGFEKVVLWDVSNIHFREAYARVRNGSILLFHANIMDVRCISQLIPKLLEDGYEIVTVSQLFDRPPILEPSQLPATATDLMTTPPAQADSRPSASTEEETKAGTREMQPIPTPGK